MFIGREKELEKLNNLYDEDEFQFAVIYGRRRIGKTTLINQFVRDKKTILFTGVESTMKENLSLFSQSILNIDNKDINVSSLTFGNFNDALDNVYELAKKEKVVLVIDEYPYLASSYKAISSILQLYIDTKFQSTNLFLILCGSSMSFMEEQVLGYKSPLYGRRTAQFKIKHFDFFTMAKYYNNFSIEDLAIVYGMTGGIPLYMSLIKDNKSIEDNVKRNFLDKTSYLYEEPSNLLKQEVRQPAMYNAVIGAIANGKTKINEISTYVDADTATTSGYIKSLISLGIIKKEIPIGATNSRKTIYTLEDNMFKFWHKFIPKNLNLIENEMIDSIYSNYISKEIPEYMGYIFEDICKEWLWIQNANMNLPFIFREVGRWWGNDKTNKCEAEVDILAIDNEDSVIIGECKWTNKPVDLKQLNALINRKHLFNYTNKYYYYFSKSGYTDDCTEQANKSDNIFLITFKDMI